MKPLKPAHREKKRYLLIKGKDANKKNIEETILEFIGVLGFADACPKFIKISKGNIILMINHNSLDKVRTGFLMSNKNITISKVSGSIVKVKGD